MSLEKIHKPSSISSRKKPNKSFFILRKSHLKNKDQKTNYRDSKLYSTKGKGSKMNSSTKQEMESGFGRDFKDVNIHIGSDAVQMNQELGARAFTNGNDIYFNKGEFNPSTKEGKYLLAHELTHTIQQSENVFQKELIQRDIKDSGPNMAVEDGEFRIDMTSINRTKKQKRAGEQGTIEFMPRVGSVNTNEIGLVQVVRSTNVKRNEEVNSKWYDDEKDRMSMRTSANTTTYKTKEKESLKSISESETLGHITSREIFDANSSVLLTFDEKKEIPKDIELVIPEIREGYFLDHLAGDSKAEPRGQTSARDVPLFYRDYWPNEFLSQDGYKKSDDEFDIQEATLADWPSTESKSLDIIYKFETVARSKDKGFDYGTLYWGFEINKGIIGNEYHHVKEGTSMTFKSSISEFNKFYKNHHTVVEGDTLKSLAKLYYGDESKSSEIQTANGLGKTELSPGQKLIMPDVTH